MSEFHDKQRRIQALLERHVDRALPLPGRTGRLPDGCAVRTGSPASLLGAWNLLALILLQSVFNAFGEEFIFRGRYCQR